MRSFMKVQRLPDGEKRACDVCRQDAENFLYFTHTDRTNLPIGPIAVYQESREGYSLCDPHLAEFRQKYYARKVVQFSTMAVGVALAGISYGVFRGTTADVVLYAGLTLLGVSFASFFLLPMQVPKKDKRLMYDKGPI